MTDPETGSWLVRADCQAQGVDAHLMVHLRLAVIYDKGKPPGLAGGPKKFDISSGISRFRLAGGGARMLERMPSHENRRGNHAQHSGHRCSPRRLSPICRSRPRDERPARRLCLSPFEGLLIESPRLCRGMVACFRAPALRWSPERRRLCRKSNR